MTNHEKLLDAMNGVDEKFLSVHIRKKCPTAADKAKRYAFAVAAYAAAIVAVAVILPFIIRHGEDPTPKPGGDPVATETTAPMSEDTEARRIDIADIDAKYNGTDPGKQADKVTLDEVKAIISASRQAYAEYDVIVLEDGTLLPTKAKLQNYTLEQLEELSEDKLDTLFEEYYVYFNNMFSVIEEMLDLRFPEKCIFQRDLDDMFPCYYVMNLPDTGFASAEEMLGFDAPREWDEDIYREWMYIGDATDPKTLYYLDSNAEDRTMLYPTAEEYEIQKAVDKWNEERVIPKAVEEFDGLRFTISLDKENYGLDDEVVAYVQIENIGDKAVALWQPVLSHYIYDVRFFEDGVEKPEFWAQQWDYPESEESRFLIPGQAIKTCRTFTPGTPMIDGKEPASMDSTWEITAYVKYLPDPPEELAELDLSKLKTGSVTVDVPHLFGGTEKPSETTPEVTTEPSTETTTTTAPPPPETTTTTAPPETEPPVVIPPLEEGQSISGDFVMLQNWVVKYFGNGGDVALPDGTTMIFEGAFEEKGHTIKSLHIPASFNSAIVGNALGGLTSLQYYSVDENCNILETVDGALYNKRVGINANAKCSLISVPGGYTDFVVPANVESISWCAFMNCTNMNYIYVDGENQTYTSYLGIVITKDRKQIAGVPPGIEEINVPAETGERFLGFVRDLPLGACKNLRRFIVDSGNPLFSSVDGILYSKDGTILYSAPGGVIDCSIPDGVKKIDWGAFRHTSKIANVYIPDSVTEINEYAFGNAVDDITSPNVVIHCSAGSYAAKYAAENGIAYVTE